MFCMHVCFVPHASLGTGVIVSHQVGAVKLRTLQQQQLYSPTLVFIFFFNVHFSEFHQSKEFRNSHWYCVKVKACSIYIPVRLSYTLPLMFGGAF